MAHEFKKLGDVEIAEAISESANVLIEEDGVIKKAPKSAVGGGGDNLCHNIIEYSVFNNTIFIAINSKNNCIVIPYDAVEDWYYITNEEFYEKLKTALLSSHTIFENSSSSLEDGSSIFEGYYNHTIANFSTKIMNTAIHLGAAVIGK